MYRVGFVKALTKDESAQRAGQHIASCNCGAMQFVPKKQEGITCAGCGNTRFISLVESKRVAFPYLTTLDKSRRGFRISKTSLSIYYDKDNQVKLKENRNYILEYDLVDQRIALERDGEAVSLTEENYTDAMKGFFRGIDPVEFIQEAAVDEEMRTLLDFAYNHISGRSLPTYYGRTINPQLYRGLKRLWEYPHVQVLAFAGYTHLDRFEKAQSYFNNPVILNIYGKNPQEILDVPKFVLPFIKRNATIRQFELRYLKKALEKIEGNKLKTLMEIAEDEGSLQDFCQCAESIIELHQEYGYTNLQKLSLYLFREIRMYQGIKRAYEGVRELLDYLRMARDLNYETEKYPKSLKREHDLVSLNHSVHMDAKKQTEFQEAVQQPRYLSKELKRKEYTIRAPRKLEELILEGSHLSHCVGSYTESIITNKCQIYFLRRSSSPDVPLVTVEVRNGNIRQAKGHANRSLASAEKAFIAEWAEQNQLNVSYY